MKNLDPARAKWIKIRMGIVCGILGLGLGFVVSGADRIQNQDGSKWLEAAERQRQRRLHIVPKRGTIFDRNGTPLAESVEVPSISMDAVEMLRGIDDQYIQMRIDQYSERISQALSLPIEDVRDKISRRRRFNWLKRRVSEDELVAVRALTDNDQRYPIRGLAIEGEGRRFYPNRELAGPLIGFVSPDGDGKEGLELSLNDELKGKPSEVHGLRDRSGRLIFSGRTGGRAGPRRTQRLPDHRQSHPIRRRARARCSSEDLRGPRRVDRGDGPADGRRSWRWRAAPVTTRMTTARQIRATGGTARWWDRYEPGSTMKIFTFASAFANKSIGANDPIYCEEGRMPIDNVVIHDTHVSKWLTPTQILQVSSNIGAAKVALGLGQERLYEGFRKFGFGESPGLPIPGQSIGVLRPRERPWVQVETASAAFGQGISVTTMQLAVAVSAIANRGRLLEPLLVKRVADSTGVILETPTTRVRRMAVPPSVSKLMSEMLVSVTEGEGTGVEAQIPGFRVAGKTATAQKIDPETGKYTDTKYIASFVGFVPAEKPRLVIVVAIDEPMAGTYAGGSVAAPVFRRIGEMGLRYLGVTPNNLEKPKLTDLADAARGMDSAEEAYKAVSEAKGEPVKPEVTAAGKVQPARKPKSGEALVPDLAGFPAREAVRTAVGLGLKTKIEGTGLVLRQDPAANTIVPAGTAITIMLEPPT